MKEVGVRRRDTKSKNSSSYTRDWRGSARFLCAVQVDLRILILLGKNKEGPRERGMFKCPPGRFLQGPDK